MTGTGTVPSGTTDRVPEVTMTVATDTGSCALREPAAFGHIADQDDLED